MTAPATALIDRARIAVVAVRRHYAQSHVPADRLDASRDRREMRIEHDEGRARGQWRADGGFATKFTAQQARQRRIADLVVRCLERIREETPTSGGVHRRDRARGDRLDAWRRFDRSHVDQAVVSIPTSDGTQARAAPRAVLR